MIKFLKKLLGFNDPNIRSFLNNSAIIIDVRNPGEYEVDHIYGSKLIPLPQLNDHISQMKEWEKPIIAYCRSGRRSGIAVKILRQNGIEAVNGGGLKDMKKYIR